jgi:hypothetical protein
MTELAQFRSLSVRELQPVWSKIETEEKTGLCSTLIEPR